MSEPLPPVRRIVTAIGEEGRSFVAADGQSPNIRLVPERPGYRISNLWCTFGSSASVRTPDRIEEVTGLLPPGEGTVLRIIDFPPEPKDPEERRRAAEATFGSLSSDARHANADHPAMHTTCTIDYAIVLDGEIIAILDDQELLMKRGDVLIQRGTSHAWANRSSQMARVAFVLIDAKP